MKIFLLYKSIIDAIKNEILSDATNLAIQSMGSGKYPIGNGLKACVKNNTVVSIF